MLTYHPDEGLGGTAGLEIWRQLMATKHYPFVSQMHLQGRGEGTVQTWAAAIFSILEHRGLSVDHDSRERIESCTDVDTLRAWHERSLAVARVDELFG
jgi:hypothetical protein